MPSTNIINETPQIATPNENKLALIRRRTAPPHALYLEWLHSTDMGIETREGDLKSKRVICPTRIIKVGTPERDREIRTIEFFNTWRLFAKCYDPQLFNLISLFESDIQQKIHWPIETNLFKLGVEFVGNVEQVTLSRKRLGGVDAGFYPSLFYSGRYLKQSLTTELLSILCGSIRSQLQMARVGKVISDRYTQVYNGLVGVFSQ